MNPSLDKLIREKTKAEEKIKKIESDLLRYITNDLALGYCIKTQRCYVRIGKLKSKKAFRGYFPAEKISHFIEQLKQLQKSID